MDMHVLGGMCFPPAGTEKGSLTLILQALHQVMNFWISFSQVPLNSRIGSRSHEEMDNFSGFRLYTIWQILPRRIRIESLKREKQKGKIVIKGRNKCSFFVKVILHKASATRINHGSRKSRPVPLKTHRWSRNKDNNETASVSRESHIQTIKKEKPQDQQIQLQNVYS